MGWDIELVDKEGNVVEVPDFSWGSVQEAEIDLDGRIVSKPSSKAWMLVTFNYGLVFNSVLQQLRKADPLLTAIRLSELLDGKLAIDLIATLQQAIELIGTTERDGNYYTATKGNVGYTLSILLAWAMLYPSATFRCWC